VTFSAYKRAGIVYKPSSVEVAKTVLHTVASDSVQVKC